MNPGVAIEASHVAAALPASAAASPERLADAVHDFERRHVQAALDAEGGNNHHSIVEYQGQWILFYHRWLDVPGAACTKKQRHVAAEYLHFNDDGTIRKVVRTQEGVGDFPQRLLKR